MESALSFDFVVGAVTKTGLEAKAAFTLGAISSEVSNFITDEALATWNLSWSHSQTCGSSSAPSLPQPSSGLIL